MNEKCDCDQCRTIEIYLRELDEDLDKDYEGDNVRDIQRKLLLFAKSIGIKLTDRHLQYKKRDEKLDKYHELQEKEEDASILRRGILELKRESQWIQKKDMSEESMQINELKLKLREKQLSLLEEKILKLKMEYSQMEYS
jgi:hypothetical protein